MRRLARALVVLVALPCLLWTRTSAGADTHTRVTTYTAYDADYFYAAITVHKPNLAGTQTAPFSDPLKDDAVAVFLQTEDAPAGTRRSDHSVEMAASAAGGVQLYRGATARPLSGFGDFLTTPDKVLRPFKFGVTRRGTLGGTTGRAVDDSGYTVEIAIPWVELGGAPKVGDRMRFNVASFSAAPGSAPLLSLAPAVKAADDLQNPSLWAEIVFVDAPVRSVASAPGAKVCARIFTARPLIDGTVTDGEWNKLTATAFEESAAGTAVAVGPTAAAARTRPAVALKAARRAVQPAAVAPRPMPARTPQPMPRLALALYDYSYQCDPRKAAPSASVRGADGADRLAVHPLGGYGPWLTYDRVDWHREQMEEVRRAGIDVILPIYRAGVTAQQAYSQRGLVTLASALRWLARSGRDYPLVGLYLDTASLAGPGGQPLDVRADAGRALLYAAIHEFYTAVPARFRVQVPLSRANGGPANLVILSSAASLADIDAGLPQYLRSRFAADFGRDLVVLGGTDFKGKADLDGYVDASAGAGPRIDDTGRIRLASVGPGYDSLLGGDKPPLRPRQNGETYLKDWKEALSRKVDWVLVDGWNTYANGTAVAPTQEDGIALSDITRECSHYLHAATPQRAEFLWSSEPSSLPAGATCRVAVRVLNAGAAAWAPDAVGLAVRWEKPGGSGTSPVAASLPGQVPPGATVTVDLQVTAPADAGDWSLVVDVAPVDKRGLAGAAFGASGSLPLVAPVRVTATADASVPAYVATAVASDLAGTLEAGGSYTATVTLRNDGSRPWRKADGGRIAARFWRYVSPFNGTGEPESAQPVAMADASADLPSDVAPGQEVTVAVPVTLSESDGTPLQSWSQSDNWTYQLRWEYSAGTAGEGAVTAPLSVSVVDADIGVAFTRDLTPPQLPGDRRVPVRLAIKNYGPQTWLKDATRIGYHWYYLDGTEAVWEDETTPILQDVEPGSETPEMLVWVTAPPFDGAYWLVWDVKTGDTWASTLTSSRPFETSVHPIEVIRGRLTFANLDTLFNVEGITPDFDRSSGDFDGAGRSLPAELVPPFVGATCAPATLWMPARAVGLDSPRRISFRWGPKGDGQKNVVRCEGQRVVVSNGRAKEDPSRAVHILAAATRDGATASFTLVFQDGSQQLASFPLSRWDGPPSHGEEVAVRCRYTHTKAGEDPAHPVSLYHYVVRITDRIPKRVVAVMLPNAPEVRVAAITVER